MTASDGVVVLMYHCVGEFHTAWDARYAVTPSQFEAHMVALERAGFRAAAADALIEWLEGGPSLPAGSFVLTFDDGFRGVKEHAFPLLQRLGWPFTVFLVSRLIGGSNEWARDENPDGPMQPLLGVAEILEMQRAGVAFHSHTCTHTSLPALDDERLRIELSESRRALQDLLDRPVDYLAYPFGHVDERVATAAKRSGYRAAFSTQPGFNGMDVDRLRLRRIDVYGSDTPAMLMRKIRLGTNDGSLSNLARYYLGRATSRLQLSAR